MKKIQLKLISLMAIVMMLINVSYADDKIVGGVIKVEKNKLSGYGKQLWAKGILIDSKGRRWIVKGMPGSDKAWEFALWGKQTAKKAFKKYGTKELYTEDIFEAYKDGSEYVTDGIKLTFKNGIWETMIKDTGSNYMDSFHKMQRIYSQKGYGWVGAYLKEFGKGIFNSTGSVLWGAVKATGGVIETVYGGFYTVVVPTFKLVYPALEGSVAYFAGGVASEGTFIWNGLVWVEVRVEGIIYDYTAPEKDTWNLKLDRSSIKGNKREKTIRVLGQEAFSTIVEASIMQTLNDDERKKYEAEIAELRKRIQKLEKEQRGLYREKYQLNKNKKILALQRIIAERVNYDVSKFDEKTNSQVLSDENIRNIVMDVLDKTGTHLTEDKIDIVVKKIKDNFNMVVKASRR